MTARIVPTALTLILLALAAPGGAEEPTLAPAQRAGSGPLLHGKLELSLADAVAMGLENNLDVQVQRYSPILSDYDQQIAWGAYDPELFTQLTYVDQKTPVSSSLEGPPGKGQVTTRDTTGFGGFQGILPLLSTEYSAQFDGGRYLSDRRFEQLSPKLESSWSLRLTQPLLKDLIWNEPWTQVKTTHIVHDTSLEDFRRAVMDTVRDIEGAYWTLIANDERFRVARKSVETARALLEQTKTQHEVGVVSKVEVTEAEAGLARREFEVIVAQNQYRNQLDVLINLVLGPHLRAASTLEIVPTDRPQDYVEYEVDVEAAVALAFEHRPELDAARKEVERQVVRSKFAANQRLPELDGILGFGRRGLAGFQKKGLDPCYPFEPPGPTDPPCTEDVSQGDFGNTFDDYSDSPAFTAGVRFGIPIPNTAARKRYSRTQMELRRAESLLRRQEQQVVLEVRESARNLEASQEGIASATRALASADEQLRAERIRLEYGESTPFDVLQREEQSVQAEVGLIDAYRAYRVSASSLDRNQGTILRNRNIKIDQVRALR